MKTTAETRHRNSMPTFLRPANLQIQWTNLSFSFIILACLRGKGGGGGGDGDGDWFGNKLF